MITKQHHKTDLLRDFGHEELPMEERINGCIAEYMGATVIDMKRFGKPGQWGVIWEKEHLPGHARVHLLRELEFATDWQWMILVLKKCRVNYFERMNDGLPTRVVRDMKKAYIQLCDKVCTFEINEVIPVLIRFIECEREAFKHLPF